MMNQYIADYTKHLKQALEIGQNTTFKKVEKDFSAVLICGLGGSGIGGSIIAQLLETCLSIPIVINKDYHIPSFVDANTLVICCSYSGNTEETIQMYQQAAEKAAEICVISSGGKFEKIAQEKGYNFIKIPEGYPPRAAFGLSFPQLFYAFHYYGLIEKGFEQEIQNSIDLIDSSEEHIKSEAKSIAQKLHGKIPVLYCESKLEGVAIRLRQQINENGKMLCWHHVIPEMNHNELVGWRFTQEQVAVLFIKGQNTFYRNEKRMDYSKDVMAKYTKTIESITAKGKSSLEEVLYLIHLGDWISAYLAELNNIDAIEIEVIIGLKETLANLK